MTKTQIARYVRQMSLRFSHTDSYWDAQLPLSTKLCLTGFANFDNPIDIRFNCGWFMHTLSMWMGMINKLACSSRRTIFGALVLERNLTNFDTLSYVVRTYKEISLN